MKPHTKNRDQPARRVWRKSVAEGVGGRVGIDGGGFSPQESSGTQHLCLEFARPSPRRVGIQRGENNGTRYSKDHEAYTMREPGGWGRCPASLARRRADEDRARPPRWSARAKTAPPRRSRPVRPYVVESAKKMHDADAGRARRHLPSPSPRGYGECPSRTSEPSLKSQVLTTGSHIVCVAVGGSHCDRVVGLGAVRVVTLAN